jgi:hypothetical protein
MEWPKTSYLGAPQAVQVGQDFEVGQTKGKEPDGAGGGVRAVSVGGSV